MKNLLNPIQKKFLAAFQKSELSKHFYWSGGTLLSSYYLHHRFSEDLDFFSEDLFPDDYLAGQILDLKNKAGAKKMDEQKRLNRHQLVFWYGKDSLKVEFVYYPFQAIASRKKLADFGITIDSLKDIAANKIHAAFERSEPKDIFDIYWIMHKGKFSFKDVFPWVEKKFGARLDPVSLIAKILDRIPSLEKIRPLVFNKSFLQPKKMKEYFGKEANKFLRKNLA